MGAIGMTAGILALAVSLSGVAGAVSSGGGLIRKGDIARGAVTAKALAPGAGHARAIAGSAVTTPKLDDDAVNRRVLKKGSVTARALAPNAVTAGAVAPGSIYGGALAKRTLHVTSIKDADAVASNPEWTAGDTGSALCGPGEVLMGTGFAMVQPGNREVSWLQALPVLSGTGDSVSGRFASNSGGSAEGQIVALCLGGP
ncbi:MAG TPA: hypothetical protein VFN18_05510 [Solirubrobacterales bacterium]|nr:hypothetical protein [Solirubrobacterales bacterium]